MSHCATCLCRFFRFAVFQSFAETRILWLHCSCTMWFFVYRKKHERYSDSKRMALKCGNGHTFSVVCMFSNTVLKSAIRRSLVQSRGISNSSRVRNTLRLAFSGETSDVLAFAPCVMKCLDHEANLRGHRVLTADVFSGRIEGLSKLPSTCSQDSSPAYTAAMDCFIAH